jgi:hypothetical protein
MPDKAHYNPVEAHKYYEEHKRLKGRNGGSGAPSPGTKKGGMPRPHPIPPKPKLSSHTQEAVARVARLRTAVSKLQSALSAAEAELSKKRQAARETAKKNSDGKSTAKEKAAAKKYRDKHKTALASKRKASSSKSGGSSSSGGLSSMSVDELTSRISRIKSALADAQRQLSNAQQAAGHLAHSDLISEPGAAVLFAQFRSAERTPSK